MSYTYEEQGSYYSLFKASEERNAALMAALQRSRAHIITLGGGYCGEVYGDSIHNAVLDLIDAAIQQNRSEP